MIKIAKNFEIWSGVSIRSKLYCSCVFRSLSYLMYLLLKRFVKQLKITSITGMPFPLCFLWYRNHTKRLLLADMGVFNENGNYRTVSGVPGRNFHV
jgi:hypothetical protein